MDRQRTLKNKRSGSRTTKDRKLSYHRLWIVAMLFALCLTGAVHGQEECLTKCQRDLADCIQAGQGDPVQSSICQDRYDACCAACIGF